MGRNKKRLCPGYPTGTCKVLLRTDHDKDKKFETCNACTRKCYRVGMNVLRKGVHLNLKCRVCGCPTNRRLQARYFNPTNPTSKTALCVDCGENEQDDSQQHGAISFDMTEQNNTGQMFQRFFAQLSKQEEKDCEKRQNARGIPQKAGCSLDISLDVKGSRPDWKSGGDVAKTYYDKEYGPGGEGPIRGNTEWDVKDVNLKADFMKKYIKGLDRDDLHMLATCGGDGREIASWKNHVVKISFHDISQVGLLKAEQNMRKYKKTVKLGRLIRSDISDLVQFGNSLKDEEFDVITGSFSLGYSQQPSKLVRLLYNHLTVDGRMVFLEGVYWVQRYDEPVRYENYTYDQYDSVMLFLNTTFGISGLGNGNQS